VVGISRDEFTNALAGHVLVEDHVNIGWGNRGFTSSAAWVRCDARSDVEDRQDVPPFVIADGNPAGRPDRSTRSVSSATALASRTRVGETIVRVVFRAGYNRTQALEKLREHALSSTPEFKHFLSFGPPASAVLSRANSGRMQRHDGICRARCPNAVRFRSTKHRSRITRIHE